ncbi:MAG: hypothetical protein ACR2NN_21020 [Bryobacteraceae bacterium]
MVRRLIVGACLTVLIAGASFAQSKPDFSGTWKLNVEKSDFGPLPAPTSRIDVIQHSDPVLKDSVTADTAQGKQEYIANYTTDGKEALNKLGPLQVKSTLTWEGNNLVVNSKATVNENDIAIKSVWSLSADGKTISQMVHLTSPMGEADQKWILEKQDGAAATSAASSTASLPASTATAAKISGGPKPNFSGTWKLNVAKSDFGVIPGPESRTDIIDHNDPSLKIATKEDGPQGKRDYVMVLTTDGKENVNNPGIEIKSASTWEGPALVTNTKLKFQENDIAIKNVMTLSDDGKTLTVNAHLSGPMGEADQKFVYEKQS